MKNFAHETTGHEYFKKRNDRVLKKKIPLMITIGHLWLQIKY